MIRKFLLPVLLLCSLMTFAQQGTSSPYSFYGIGDIRFKGTAENRAMGGVSVFTDSIHINLQNPASYSQLKLTTFTIGGTFSASKYTSLNANEKAQRTTLDYLAVGIPMGKFGAAFGLIPYSSVGYKTNTVGSEIIGGTNYNINRAYSGDGGLNKVFVGLGYEIMPKLSIGVDINYNFGRIETSNIKDIPAFQYGTREQNNSELSGFNVNFGAMYERKITNKLDLYGSLGYSPETKLTSKNERIFSSIVYSEEVTSPTVEALETLASEEKLNLASRFSLGAGIGQKRKWLAGAEITLLQTGNMGNRFSDITTARFENGMRYNVGGYYIPNYNSFSSYFSKVVYRAGMRYEKTGLVVSNEPIKDYAFTAGFGLPLGGTFSNLNLSVEFGRRGTAKALLVEENYTNVIMSFSLNDKWFVKRRYD